MSATCSGMTRASWTRARPDRAHRVAPADLFLRAVPREARWRHVPDGGTRWVWVHAWVQRLVRGIADLANLPVASTARRIVVVNRVRASAAGSRPGDALRASLGRFAGIDAPHLVPDDRTGVDAAVLRGATLREAASGSPARRAIVALAALRVQPDQARRAPRRAIRFARRP